MIEPVTTRLEEVIWAFADFGIEAAYLTPTQAGLDHDLLDADAGVRAFLASRGIHDFDAQAIGQEHKITLPIGLVGREDVKHERLSLYRPPTKAGAFTRLWISGLADYASAGDLLAIVAPQADQLFVVNCSDNRLMETRHDRDSPLNDVLIMQGVSPAAADLRALLTDIGSRGFVPTMRPGDTGVGYTLESLLGIPANSSKRPDYRGIEIKAGRTPPGKKRATLQTLLAMTPDRDRSACSAAETIERYGSLDADGRMGLYCTVRANPNPQGLYLVAEEGDEDIRNRCRLPDGTVEEVALWPLAELQARLAKKHRETFWVKAQTRRHPDGTEEFHYVSALHTKGPLLLNLPLLIAEGIVMLDYTMHFKPSGGVRDHGYLWRIAPHNLPLLFPDPIPYDLTSAPTR